MNIRKKLTIITLLLVAIPLLLFSFGANYYFSRSLKQSALTINESRSREIQLEIQAYVDQGLDVLKVLSKDPAVQSMNPNIAKPLLVEVQKSYPHLSIALDAGTGQQLAKGDDNGLVNIADRNFFKDGMSGKKDVISEVLVSKVDNSLIIVLAQPIYDQTDGKVLGVMQASLPLSRISDFVSKQTQNGLTAYVVDHDGKILAHPNKELTQARKDMSQLDYIKEGLSGKTSSLETTGEDGTKVIFTDIYDVSTGWLICTEIPESTALAQSKALSNFFIIVVVGGLALLGIIIFIVVSRISKPIRVLEKTSLKLADGDFTENQINVKSKDELGSLARSFEKMINNLSLLIQKIKLNSEKVAAAASEMLIVSENSTQSVSQVASSITQISSGSDDTAQNVQRTVLNMQALDEQIQSVVGEAKEATRMVMDTNTYSSKGKEVLNRVTFQMDDVLKTVMTSSEVVQLLGHSSQEIGKIVNVIADIAGQTNLLALNAAIEAARAGESGRGFAVVAEEVRKLAEQSAGAAQEISDLIHGIQDKTANAMTTMQKGVEEVQEGNKLFQELHQSFEAISGAISRVSGNIMSVSSSLQEMENNAEEVLSYMHNISAISQETSAGIQSVVASSEEQVATTAEMARFAKDLEQMAESLNQLIGQFKTH